MENSFKKKVVSGIAWKYAERMLAQIISTIVAIVLARILDPSHYGMIAIVNVFITICNVFVVTGMGESLVQKKDSDDIDFSTVFYMNVGLSVGLYSILFFSAPYIEVYYGESYSGLTAILRIMGLRLILAAANSIQNAKISKDLAFKKYFYVTLTGTVVSAIVGIYMAYSGYGVWALVAQYMTNSTIDTIMLFIFVKWFPNRTFSLKRAKPLIKYGIRIIGVSVLDTLYDELRSMIIGKRYSSDDLAFYSKGSTYPKLVVNNFSSAIASVLFPAFAKIQNDIEAMQRLLRKAIRTSSYVLFPVLMGLFVVADLFVEVILTKKWLPCVPYLRIMCIIYMLKPLAQPSNQCLTATGKSGLYGKMAIIKKIFGISVLLLSIPFGVIWVAYSQLISVAFDYILSVVVGGKTINYGLLKQVGDWAPHFAMSVLMGIVVMVSGRLMPNITILRLVGEIVIGVLMYVGISMVCKNEIFMTILRTIRGNK